ncbi:hypothetical protein [Novosphingobium sp. P6W]|uniref:hypothetical protein n=1 Tax=Novosphingobium sp. P6W TaxID=1609758 RepID=UPI0013B46C4E|nr:hypothetical protein [Novosphingobium sp. P6W]
MPGITEILEKIGSATARLLDAPHRSYVDRRAGRHPAGCGPAESIAVYGFRPPTWDSGANRLKEYRTEGSYGLPGKTRGLALVIDPAERVFVVTEGDQVWANLTHIARAQICRLSWLNLLNFMVLESATV